MPKKTTAQLPRAKGKAKGSFFADKATRPYAAKGMVLGQATIEACVPAVCRMLIFDRFPHLEADVNFSESYLRHFLQTDAEGSAVAAISAVLQLAGMAEYEYRQNLTMEDLRAALNRGFAVVSVRGKSGKHVLIVETLTADHVALRDSLPENQGSSYWIGCADFQAVWLAPKTQRGTGVVVVE